MIIIIIIIIMIIMIIIIIARKGPDRQLLCGIEPLALTSCGLNVCIIS